MADTALAVSFTRITGERRLREVTRALDFPYCSKCVQHSRWWGAAFRAAAAVMACGALAGLVVGLVVGAAPGAGVAALAGSLAVAVGLALRTKARTSCFPSCSSAGPAVTYHGWDGPVQTLSFTSRRYAAAFAAQNEHSLVNVTPHLYQLVEQRRVAVQEPPTEPTEPARTAPLWPQRIDRARSLFDQVMSGRAIQADGMVKRHGRAS